MRTSAQAAFFPWLGKFEGLYLDDGSFFQWLGLDTKGRPCTALGVDLPSPAMMQAITWRHGTDASSPIASPAEVAQEWRRVQAMQACAGQGAASTVFRSSAQLFFDPASLYAWCGKKLAIFETWVQAHSPIGDAWPTLPSVVQMARARTLWADGEIVWPKMDAAIARGDWSTAAAQCWPSDAGPDPEDPATLGRKTTQPPAYVKSYNAVRDLYELAAHFSGDALPEQLPNGEA